MEHFKDFSPLIKKERFIDWFTNYSFFMTIFFFFVAAFAGLVQMFSEEAEIQSIIPGLVFAVSVVLILLGFILSTISNHLKVTIGSTALACIRELKESGIEYLGYSFAQKQEPMIIVHTKEEDFCLPLNDLLNTNDSITTLKIIETKIHLHIACIKKLIDIFDTRKTTEENRAREERGRRKQG